MSDNKNIRIKDIAKMAGVSVGTVDRVIHKRGKVAEDIQKKIEKVLKETGYKPNLLARTLGSNKAVKIAILIPDPDQDEYWALSQAGIDQSLQEWSQYNLELSAHHFDLYDSSSFASIAQSVLDLQPDGVVAAPIFHHESLDFFGQLKKQNIPFVLFNTNLTELNPLSFIGQDLYQSGKVAGELLSYCIEPDDQIAVLHISESIENSVHLKAKESGLRDFVQKDYLVQSHDLNNVDDPNFETEVERILREPELGGVFVSTSKGTHIIASILEQCDLRHIKLVGYDLLAKNLEHLQRGNVNFLINQNPKRMTLVGISHLTNYLLFHKDMPSKELFPLEIITPQNVDSYIQSRIH
ncbi:LacI family DNA-binding transcriptional regulator [Reichenbachiella agarivorans]|uniref:LacI family DNA-binding transcriptional regulator n=1 Tax=Reichenbachiella agarivorans TaxID=2979464 RepID=A0ABY6CWN4_9BACT|nr:LacI family DNA-binding transcriptional regulator [Reichenbachiella agarivorans]UXP33863.1 LacI family DNA-binding transcriptional regulator [Reichenbachiella agarivorans]